jgi:hypothetical protein
VSAPVVFTLLVAVVVAVLLALMGCSGVGEMEYRAATAYSWERKGQQVARAILQYCLEATEKEKAAFWWGVETVGSRAKILVQCGP